MPLCADAPNCNCRPCKISDMSYHPLFKERVDMLITEYEEKVPPKPKQPAPSGDIY